MYYNWDNFDNDIGEIKTKFKEDNYQPKAVFGIPKGGLPLAVKISNLFDIPLFVDLIEANKKFENKKDILIVDDISDSGKTFKKIKYREYYTTLAIFIRYNTSYVPNYYLRKIDDDSWIVFGWENNKDVKIEKEGTFKELTPKHWYIKRMPGNIGNQNSKEVKTVK